LLGLIVERVAGDTLDVLAQKYFFGPLDMKQTTFFPQKPEECVPTEIVDGAEIRGIVHDESARAFARAQKAVGHAGLFSTAGDILNFLEALLCGELKDVADGARRGWGWQVNDPRSMGKYSSLHTFGKTGFTGTSIICDIERGIAFVILSNRTYPKRPPDDSAIFKFRADIAGMLVA
jgi:CubicO group peptidase (beta-lactamase class C family)